MNRKPNKGSWKPGVRPPGAGRPKGTPNKKTLEFQALLEKKNFSPGEALIKIFHEQMAIFEHRKKMRNFTGALIALDNAQTTANNICQYVYPKKKAVEHTGEVGIKTFADFIAAGSNPESK